MRIFTHTQTQHPVGQGFFYSARVSFYGHPFRYVYDCGSMNSRALKREVTQYLADLDGAPIDVLFLSHLHSDHVNGLDQLMLTCKVKCVVLPYLSPYERLLLLLAELENGTLTASHLALLSNPSLWLEERGVDRIVYMTPSTLPKQQPLELERNVLRDWDGVSIDWDSLVPVQGFTPPIGVRCKVQIASCDDQLLLGDIGGHSYPKWQFLTHVFPEDASIGTFRQRVQREFPGLVQRNRFEINATKLSRILQNHIERDALVACYCVIRNNHNLCCLSLYAGPLGFLVDWVDIDSCARLKKLDDALRVGWLGTGDARLSTPDRLQEFLAHFNPIIPVVGFLTIPHHGAKREFHEKLLDLSQLFVISCGSKNPYGHPHCDVVSVIHPERRVLVTEIPSTRLHLSAHSVGLRAWFASAWSQGIESLHELKRNYRAEPE